MDEVFTLHDCVMLQARETGRRPPAEEKDEDRVR